MAKKNRLPKLAQNTTLEQGIQTLSEGISIVAEQVGQLDLTMQEGLSGVRQELQRNGNQLQAAIIRQSNIFEKSFGVQAKRLDKLVDIQNQIETRSASRMAAEEEAKMEQKDTISVFLSIDDSMKKLLAAVQRGGAIGGAGGEGQQPKRGLFSTLTDMIPRRGGGIGVGRGIRLAAGAGLGAAAGGRIGEMFGETGETIGQIAGGALGAAGLGGAFGRKTPTTVPTPSVPPVPTAPTPVIQPPVTATPGTVGGLTPDQQEKYKKLREQGVSPADAKAQAARREGIGGLADAEKQLQGKTAAPAKPAAEVAETVAKKPGMLGRAVGAAGKAARFIPGVGLVLAAGEAAYSSGSAAYNAEETLGIKDRAATTGERVAAGAGGLAESLSFGLISKESAGGFFKGLTGAGPDTKPVPPAPVAPPPPAPAAPSTGGMALAPSTTAKAVEAKPKVSISGQEDIKNMIKRHEGFVPHPYKDSLGLWTIGYGHLIGDGKSLPPEWNRPITKAEGEVLFEEDYAHHRKAAEKIPGFSRMNEKGQGALTDLTFNMGPSWFRKWPKLQESLKAGDTEAAASNLESSKWYQQVKSRGPTIVSLVRQGKDAGAATEYDSKPETKPIGDIATPVMTESGTPLMTGYGGVVTSGGADAVQSPSSSAAPPSPSTSGPTLQAGASNRGVAVQGMSERVASSRAASPVVINNNTTNQTTNAAGGGGNGKGIPSPYAARGSLDIGTTFVGAA